LVAAIARALGLADAGERLLDPAVLIDRFSWGKVPAGPIAVVLRD
jgi:hypothetical protein